MLKSIFGLSQVTYSVMGFPWKEAPWGRMVRGAAWLSSTVVMYFSAISSTRSMLSMLIVLKKPANSHDEMCFLTNPLYIVGNDLYLGCILNRAVNGYLSLDRLESILSTRLLARYCIIACVMKRLYKICFISAFSLHNIN